MEEIVRDLRQSLFPLIEGKGLRLELTGNFAVISMIPYVRRTEMGTQGWKKMFFLNPDDLLTEVDHSRISRES